MQQLFEFILRHWVLVVLLLVIFAVLIYEETKNSSQGVLRISPQKLVDLVNRDDALIIDTRDVSAYQKGHIINALNLNAAEIEKGNKQLESFKNKPIVLVCQKGMISVALGAKLRKQGFTQVHMLAGGMEGWRNASLPTVKK
jgi:rhodanese-related sulfurtransferase